MQKHEASTSMKDPKAWNKHKYERHKNMKQAQVWKTQKHEASASMKDAKAWIKHKYERHKSKKQNKYERHTIIKQLQAWKTQKHEATTVWKTQKHEASTNMKDTGTKQAKLSSKTTSWSIIEPCFHMKTSS